MRKYLLVCLSFTLPFMLASCGGGDSTTDVENTSSEVNASESGPVHVRGVATKGVLQNLAVTAYELDEHGRRAEEPVGRAQTDDDGAYELEFQNDYGGGLIEIEVTVIDGTSTMICDATLCGDASRFEEVALPSDFALSAIVEKPAASNSLNMSVTAWSTMAAKRARSIHNADQSISLNSAIKQAESEVSQIVGFDIRRTESADLSQIGNAEGAQAQYAIMNAAVAEILFRGNGSGNNGSGNLVERLKKFTSALNSDGIIGSGDETFDLADLSRAIRLSVSKTPALDDTASESLNNLTAQYDLSGSNGFAPGYNKTLAVDENATQDEKIAAFQHFFSQVRTWMSSLEDLNGDSLSQVVHIDAKTVQTVTDREVRQQFQLLGEILDRVAAYILENPDRVEEGGQDSVALENEDGDPVGSVSLSFSGGELLQVSMIGEMNSAEGNISLPFQLTLTTDMPITELISADRLGANGSVGGLARLFGNSNISLAGYIEDGRGNQTITLNELTLSLDLNPSFGPSDPESASGVFRKMSLLGDVAISKNGAGFSGGIEVGFVRLGSSSRNEKEADQTPIFSENFRLSGEFSSADGSHHFSTSVTVNLKSTTAFDTFAWGIDNDDRYISGVIPVSDELFSAESSAFEETFLSGYSIRADLDSENRNGTIYFDGYSAVDESLVEHYRSCLEDVDWQNLDVTDLADIEAACANSNVGPISEERPLSSAELDALEDMVTQRLVSQYGEKGDPSERFVLGKIYGFGGLGGRDGRFTAAYRFADIEVSRNYWDESFTISSRVDIPELRSGFVSATVNRTSYRGGDMRINVKWDGGSYTAMFSVDNIDLPTRLNARLFNAQGYELNLDVEFDDKTEIKNLSGDALLNGESIGQVKLRDKKLPVIMYPSGDGDIVESLY